MLDATSTTNLDPYGAFVEINDECGSTGGPLSGIRLAVKDNIPVEGMLFTAGHPLYRARRASVTSPAVSQLCAAGCHLVGMVKTDSGGFGVTTPDVINPVSPGRVVGGSSGGAAAALAGGLADIALGTDTGGSVRIPSACCELFAFKPTYGTWSTEGAWPLAPSLDHLGLMAKDFELLKKGAEAIGLPGGDAHDRVPRIGVDLERLRTYDPTVSRKFLAVLNSLRAAGLPFFDVRVPVQDRVTKVHSLLVLGEARAQIETYSRHERELLGLAARRAVPAVERLDDRRLKAAQQSRLEIASGYQAIFDSVDVVLGPTIGIELPAVDQDTVVVREKTFPVVTALVSETCLANVVGAPALVVPVRTGEPEEPLSIQLCGPKGEDRALILYGALIMEALNTMKSERRVDAKT